MNMYRFAYRFDDKTIFYFDFSGNKYVATGGNLAWRINNPGLVRSHSHFAKRNKSIGSCKGYAIFPEPRNGQKALQDWLHAKKYFDSTLKTLGEHYQPNNPEVFVQKVSAVAGFSPERKINSLNKIEFDALMRAIENYCGYSTIGNEILTLLPKITAKIENGAGKDDTYLIGDNIVLSKQEAIEWILSHKLDGVVVHHRDNSVSLRSRPGHQIWNIKTHESVLPPSEGKIETLVRSVGDARQDQCIWAFINGIDNKKEDALESAELISNVAGGERVFSMPNDTMGKLIDFCTCCVLKVSIDTPIISWAIKFLRYLLSLEKESGKSPPVIVFVHSQGAIIMEHALEFLSSRERERLRVFTFGGGSFIAREKSHPDSHNYASAADFVCRFGSPNLQLLALERYYGHKEGLDDQQVINRLAFRDAIHDLDSIDHKVIEAYAKQRASYYEKEFLKISNLTILGPDPGSNWKHTFSSDCYQQTIKTIVQRYQNQ